MYFLKIGYLFKYKAYCITESVRLQFTFVIILFF